VPAAQPPPATAPRSGRLLLSLVILVAGLGLLVGVLVVRGGPGGDTAGPSRTTRPNIVLILTDDQRWDQLTHMPTVESQLVGKGVDFTNGFVVDPLCCPSRTTILTGKYSHSTGIYWNNPPHGGFQDFEHEEGSTVATWLQAAHYRTALVGKYLNGYEPADTGHVPPGWDVWDAMALEGPGDGEGGYYDYALSENGRQVRFGSSAADYSTDVLTRLATGFITSTPSSQPLFLYYAPRAPHLPSTPAPRDEQACPDTTPQSPASFDQRDVSDMPAYVRSVPPMSAARRAKTKDIALENCRALLGVDDSVKAILDALRRTGRLSNTLILYSSDNGFMLGEHRLTGKAVPYDESIRVPVVVRYDPVTHQEARTDPHLVLNLDFAQTFAAAAAVDAPGADGRNLLTLLRNPGAPWRSRFLIEHWQPGNPRAHHTRPPYCAVRTTTHMYVKYATGEQELYDVRSDPYELRNLARVPADHALLHRLHAQMVTLCRPPPPGFSP